MDVAELVIAGDVRMRIPADDLQQIAASLHRGDCQTCNRTLADPIALCVDDMTTFGVATLHHNGCRPSGWNNSALVRAASVPTVSYTSRTMTVPVRDPAGNAEPYPVMMVNPTLESVWLARTPLGRWNVDLPSVFRKAGMVAPGPQLQLDRPLRRVTATVGGRGLAIRIGMPPFTVYEAPTDASAILGQMRRRGGVLFVITHSVDPGRLDAGQIDQAMTDGRSLMGWVAVAL